MRLNQLWLEYKGYHHAPNAENGAPLYDLKTIYPDDIYSADGARIYGARWWGKVDEEGESYDEFAITILRLARGDPDRQIKVYRAVPKSLPSDVHINPGDWVTITRQYAELHGDYAFKEPYKILTKTVRAKELYTEGSSIHEWGYNPS